MIIVVAGLPGSGKSFFAKKLAERLDAAYLNTDQVRNQLKSKQKYSFDDKLAVYRQMAHEASVEIESKRDVVIDGTFYHHTLREMFARLADGYATSIYVIEIVADEEIIRKRLKHARELSEADFLVYEKIRDEYEEITMPHLTLVSGDNGIEEMIGKAIEYAGK